MVIRDRVHDLSLPDRIGERLRAGGMPARDLCLEVTESATFKDAALSMDILSRVRLKGMSLSIDDFGTGYSSLKTLRQMPFSELKIDRSFVSDMAVSRDSHAIVKTIIQLAANMGLGCVAEGVETEATAELIEGLGVTDLQGSLIAQPMPVEAVAAWLAIWTHDGSGTPAPESEPPGHKPAARSGGAEAHLNAREERGPRRATNASAAGGDGGVVRGLLREGNRPPARHQRLHRQDTPFTGLHGPGGTQPHRGG